MDLLGAFLDRTCSEAVKPPYFSHADASDFAEDERELSRSGTKAARRKSDVKNRLLRGDPPWRPILIEPECGLNELLAEWHNLTKRVIPL